METGPAVKQHPPSETIIYQVPGIEQQVLLTKQNDFLEEDRHKSFP